MAIYTAKDEGCIADGANGHAYVRQRLWDVLNDTHVKDPKEHNTQDLCLAQLAAEMSDDAWEEDEAIDLLNEHATDGDVCFLFEDGDLKLRRTDERLAKDALDVIEWHVGCTSETDESPSTFYIAAVIPEGIDAYTFLSELTVYDAFDKESLSNGREAIYLSDDNGAPIESLAELNDVWKREFEKTDIPKDRWHVYAAGVPRAALQGPVANLF